VWILNYVVAFAMRSYLMEYMSTLFFNSDSSSSHRMRNWSLDCVAAFFRGLRHPCWSKSLAFWSKAASFFGRQPRGPVSCTQKFLPPCWYIFYIWIELAIMWTMLVGETTSGGSDTNCWGFLLPLAERWCSWSLLKGG
jgi:hypothetical protein